jgi:hypothetical protein
MVCLYPDELEDAMPRYRPGAATLDQFGDDAIRSAVPRGVGSVGVNEDVSIDCDHDSYGG